MRAALFLLLASLSGSALAAPCAFEVALDAGHSDEAPGATSARGRPERAFNVRLADELAEALIAAGLKVRRLAPAPLAQRAAAAAGASMLLSLHHDSVQEHLLEPWVDAGVPRRRTRHAAGHSLFVSGRNPRFDESRRLAESIGVRLTDGGLAPTLHHAEPIPGEGRPLLDRALGLYQYDGLLLLRAAPVPAVLVEAAVIANDEDERRADDPAYRARLVKAVVEALAPRCTPNR